MKKFLTVFIAVSAGFCALTWGGSSGCGGAKCGNGVVDGSEACDGGALNGETCESQGFSEEGTLTCASDCGSFDTSGCIAPGTISGLVSVSGMEDEFLNAGADASGEVFAQVHSTSASVTVGDKTATNVTALANVFRSSIAKVNPDGTVAWLNGFQGDSTDAGSGDDASPFFGPSGGDFFAGVFRGIQLSAPGMTVPNTDATGVTYDTYVGRLNGDGSIDWFAPFNSDKNDQVFGQFDRAGNLYVTGHFDGATVDANGKPLTNAAGGTSDAFIERVDPATGAVVWIAHFSSDSFDDVFPSFDASGNIYVKGSFQGAKLQINGVDELTNASAGTTDGFVGRLDPADGHLLWRTGFSSGTGDFIQPLAIDPGGNVYAVGGFTGPTLTAGTKTLPNAGVGVDGYVARLKASDGTVEWLTGVASSAFDLANLAVDSSGNVYVSGTFFGPTLDAGGKSLTNADASGTTSDNFVGRVNIADGAFEWLLGFLGSGFSGGVMGAFPAVTDASHVYVGGAFSGATLAVADRTLTNADASGTTNDAFAAQINPDGTVGWLLGFSGPENAFVTFAADFTNDAAGNFPTGKVYLTGTFQGATLSANGETLTNADAGGTTSDAFAARIDPADGGFVWLIPISSDGDDSVSLVPDALGHLTLSGEFGGKTLTIGGQTFTNADASGATRDAFVGRIAP